MASVLRAKPYTWVTWCTGILSGQNQCLYAPWFKSHYTYEKVPSDFNAAKWSAEHTALLNEQVARLRGDGWAVTLENQNKFTVHGAATTLAGKIDIFATKGNQIRVQDPKTGQQKNEHWWQVLLYLFALPMAFADRIAGKKIAGDVVYKHGHIVPIGSEELTTERRKDIVTLLRLVGGEDVPPKVPSEQECRFCDVAECDMRFGEGTKVPVTTSEF